MSPVIVNQKVISPKKESKGMDRQDWVWVGLAVVSTWLLLTGLHRLFTDKPAPATAPAVANAPTEVVPEPAEPAPPAPPKRTFLMHDEAVCLTVKGLREHARECPDAPDVLSEEQIKAIEKQGSLIQ